MVKGYRFTGKDIPVKMPPYRSAFEYQISQVLLAKCPSKEFKIGYETEKLPYVLEKNYTPDFIITRPDGSKLYIETKGYFDLEDRSKMLAIKKNYPEADFAMVFMVDNKLHSKSQIAYSDWCTKHGFKYAFNTIPDEWFLE